MSDAKAFGPFIDAMMNAGVSQDTTRTSSASWARPGYTYSADCSAALYCSKSVSSSSVEAFFSSHGKCSRSSSSM